jgi:serine/threonine-protein kinase
MIGSTLAHYRITAQLGAGGMGEVWRATDEKLGREVALKILPEDFADDPDRHTRFEREAQVLASLNHPNIAHLYGLEHAEPSSDSAAGSDSSPRAPMPSSPPVHFLVMELVEGEGLDEVIDRGPIPIEETVSIAFQIAEALEAAHEAGVVHRDLKPANIKVTQDGTVKVLDFGLAKASQPDDDASRADESPTLTARATAAGVILGTAAYMSPEQARGKTVDRRADVWAFGVVLWEMLMGRRLFVGETVSDVLAAVLRAEPDWNDPPHGTPDSLRRMLARCLQRDPRQRLQWIGDARLDLAELHGGSPEQQEDSADAGVPSQGRRPPWWLLVATLVIGTAVGAVLAWRIGRSTAIHHPAEQAVHAAVPLADDERLAFGEHMPLGVGRRSIALSPDGMTLVYVVVSEDSTVLKVRRLDRLQSSTLSGTEGAFDPFFSPDGQTVAFFTRNKLKKVSLRGGEPITLCDAVNPVGGSWGDDDRIVFAAREGQELLRIDGDGGTPEVLTSTKTTKSRSLALPQVVNGGKTVLITRRTGTSNHNYWSIGAFDVDTGDSHILIRGGTSGQYVPTGHLVFARAGSLQAVALDLERLEVSGEPVPILDGVRVESLGAAHFSVSGTGTLAFIPGTDMKIGELVWVDRAGIVQPLEFPPATYGAFELDPRGERLAIVVADSNERISIYDLERGTTTPIAQSGNSHSPVWTSDGRSVIFGSDEFDVSSIFLTPADGSGRASELDLPTELRGATPYSASTDGRSLAVTSAWLNTGGDVWVVRLHGGTDAHPIVATSASEWGPSVSPDGRWVAYTSDTSGRYEVYVQPFPDGGRIWTVSNDGGEEPVWAPRGDELYYRNGNEWMAVPVTTGTTFSAGRPRVLFEGPFLNVPGFSYDVHADGDRFLLIRGLDRGTRSRLPHLIFNWSSQLDRSVPSGGRE